MFCIVVPSLPHRPSSQTAGKGLSAGDRNTVSPHQYCDGLEACWGFGAVCLAVSEILLCTTASHPFLTHTRFCATPHDNCCDLQTLAFESSIDHSDGVRGCLTTNWPASWSRLLGADMLHEGPCRVRETSTFEHNLSALRTNHICSTSLS